MSNQLIAWVIAAYIAYLTYLNPNIPELQFFHGIAICNLFYRSFPHLIKE